MQARHTHHRWGRLYFDWPHAEDFSSVKADASKFAAKPQKDKAAILAALGHAAGNRPQRAIPTLKRYAVVLENGEMLADVVANMVTTANNDSAPMARPRSRTVRYAPTRARIEAQLRAQLKAIKEVLSLYEQERASAQEAQQALQELEFALNSATSEVVKNALEEARAKAAASASEALVQIDPDLVTLAAEVAEALGRLANAGLPFAAHVGSTVCEKGEL
jgi:uncharacterized protein YgiM (DUF1202 family)